MGELEIGRARQRPLVLCFMAGMSCAARVSGRCYYEELVKLLEKDAAR